MWLVQVEKRCVNELNADNTIQSTRVFWIHRHRCLWRIVATIFTLYEQFGCRQYQAA